MPNYDNSITYQTPHLKVHQYGQMPDKPKIPIQTTFYIDTKKQHIYDIFISLFSGPTRQIHWQVFTGVDSLPNHVQPHTALGNMK